MAVIRVKSSIAGIIVAVEKQAGEQVAANDVIVVIECMKMHIPIPAPAAGRVQKISVKEGDAIEMDQLVCTIES